MTLRKYEVVTGFFVQDDGQYDNVCVIPKRFGLLDTTKQRWSNTIDKIKGLNANAQEGVSYKLIFIGRHGQGYHNLAELKYGTKCWDEYWAKLDGDGEIVWGPDPLLTPLGEEQARDAKATWEKEREANIPLPDGMYCSPLTRALQTCNLTFTGIVNLVQKHPLIIENAREKYGVHTCDKRRSRSYLQTEFPCFMIEEGFTEDDELYDPNKRELDSHVMERAHSALDYIFENNEEHFVSITAHGGFINGLCETAKHAPVPLPTGGILPMVLKSTILSNSKKFIA